MSASMMLGADCWKELLEPIVQRHKKKSKK